jgi:hypothetical protein
MRIYIYAALRLCPCMRRAHSSSPWINYQVFLRMNKGCASFCLASSAKLPYNLFFTLHHTVALIYNDTVQPKRAFLLIVLTFHANA